MRIREDSEVATRKAKEQTTRRDRVHITEYYYYYIDKCLRYYWHTVLGTKVQYTEVQGSLYIFYIIDYYNNISYKETEGCRMSY